MAWFAFDLRGQMSLTRSSFQPSMRRVNSTWFQQMSMISLSSDSPFALKTPQTMILVRSKTPLWLFKGEPLVSFWNFGKFLHDYFVHNVLTILRQRSVPKHSWFCMFIADYAWKTIAKIATDVITKVELLVSCILWQTLFVPPENKNMWLSFWKGTFRLYYQGGTIYHITVRVGESTCNILLSCSHYQLHYLNIEGPVKGFLRARDWGYLL